MLVLPSAYLYAITHRWACSYPLRISDRSHAARMLLPLRISARSRTEGGCSCPYHMVMPE